MILAGQLLLEDEGRPGRVRLAAGHVRVDGETIAEVVEGEAPAHYDAGGPDALISPGFIDTHLHLPQFDMMGAHGRPLLEWLADFTFPSERKWEDVDYARDMTRRVADQLLAHGTTSICAYATVHHDATAAALDTLGELGLRGVVGQTLLDREAPDYLTRPAAQLLGETADLLDRYPPGGRLGAAVTPRFAITCTPELLAGLGKLAAERDAAVQTHLAETVPECAYVAELFDGVSYANVYRSAGLLTPRSILGHGIYLDDADRATLAETGAVVAHCPTANSFLRSGTMDRRAHRAAGVRLSLGSDIGAGYERSMVRVGRAMIEAAASLPDPLGDVPSEQGIFPGAGADEAWWQITAGNADAVGWPDAGRLRVGDPADLLVIEPDVPWLSNPVQPLAMLLWAWDDRWIKRTLVQGRVAYGRG